MVFVKRGNSYFVQETFSGENLVKLPPKNYVVKFHEQAGAFYLEEIDSFTLPKRLYGDVDKNVNRFLTTFTDRPESTGVLLYGEKGSGKSMTAKATSVYAAKLGHPTIVINAPWCGEAFNRFLQTISQPCVVLFDEFEKVYDEDKQKTLLTLFDGTFPQKKLYVVTCNEKYRISSYMMNRPGRIYYSIEYGGLDESFIREYCTDKLTDESKVEAIVTLSCAYDKFNFDMLKAVVEEVNRYGESPADAVRILNAKPGLLSAKRYDVEIYKNGMKVSLKGQDRFIGVNPFTSDPVNIDGGYDDDGNSIEYEFTFNNLKSVDMRSGVFVYEKDDVRVVLTEQGRSAASFNYSQHAHLLNAYQPQD